jgi:geranylgeranyl reductase family protein
VIRPAPLDAEVAVVGAGPAGAATAAHLARAGVDVLLLDRSRFPRDKVCGDFVGPVALAELDRLGVDSPVLGRGNAVRRARLHLDGRELVERTFPGGGDYVPFGRVVRRVDFDASVVEAAVREGARLHEGFHVDGLARSADGSTTIESRTAPSLRARVVVGADGSNSFVSRWLRGGPPPRTDRIVAVRAYYAGIDGPADRADLYFSRDSFPGYYWLFPDSAETANVGVGMVQETLPRVRDHLRDLLARLVGRDEALRERLGGATLEGKVVGWPLTTYNPSLPVVGDGLVLVGDAAGLINSLNGEGIQYALLSARWAADAIGEGLAAGDVSREALAPYGRRLERELAYDLGVARLVVRLISYRALNPVWLLALRVITERARVDPAYAETTGGVLAGVVPAHSVLTPRIVGNTVRQAAVTAGLQPVRDVLRRPGAAAPISVEIARTAFDVAYDAASDHRGVTRWAAGAAASASSLAARASRDLIGATLRGRARPYRRRSPR